MRLGCFLVVYPAILPCSLLSFPFLLLSSPPLSLYLSVLHHFILMETSRGLFHLNKPRVSRIGNNPPICSCIVNGANMTLRRATGKWKCVSGLQQADTYQIIKINTADRSDLCDYFNGYGSEWLSVGSRAQVLQKVLGLGLGTRLRRACALLLLLLLMVMLLNLFSLSSAICEPSSKADRQATYFR
ncbi:hypothetical protein F5X96DRAFT_3293 [Biscogniauxia mediterranea]|nr:hypothetical protein F5X96DRAFT_3293 [Biscogniauxia mediterranea]